jgi:hypothetical protein
MEMPSASLAYHTAPPYLGSANSWTIPAGGALTPEIDTPNLYGDLFTAPDIDLGQPDLVYNNHGDCAYINDGGVMLPWGASQPGLGNTVLGGPIFKGRGDLLRSIKTPGEISAPGDGSFPGNSGIFCGDIGPWGVGDTLMFATDMDSRKVWIGKNGVWANYGHPDVTDPMMRGGKPIYMTGASGHGQVCFMDGKKAVGAFGEDGYVPGVRNYYPGISFRYGPSKARFIFSASKCTYTPPLGFNVYTGRVL